jgi:Ni/Fe-hydrogenase subunit HybB-like protein
MATVFWGVFVIALAIILAIMGQALVQRLVPVSLRESHNVATGTVYAPLYAAYGLILGFSLLMLREQNYDTQKRQSKRLIR